MTLIQRLQDHINQYTDRQIFILQDNNITIRLPFPTMLINACEANKSITSAMDIWQWLTAQGATRQALLINIGGGTVSDLGGFVAAAYLRGIDYVNIPTTLLAMTDAAIGGKTAVNFDGLKNRIGFFKQPLETITDTEFLNTLPPDELLSGYAEVIKTALLISDNTFADAVNSIDTDISPELLTACQHFKQSVVERDPMEKGLRRILNLGHTVGHALEEKTGAKHGYCVLWGLVAELYLSVILLGCPKSVLQQLVSVMLEYYGRPQCNCKEQSELIALMRKDKKNNTENNITFTLLKKIGDPVINQVAEQKVIEEALDYLFSL